MMSREKELLEVWTLASVKINKINTEEDAKDGGLEKVSEMYLTCFFIRMYSNVEEVKSIYTTYP